MRPLSLLHTCGCVLQRYDLTAPFARCPRHGYGQEPVGAVVLRDALRIIRFKFAAAALRAGVPLPPPLRR